MPRLHVFISYAIRLSRSAYFIYIFASSTIFLFNRFVHIHFISLDICCLLNSHANNGQQYEEVVPKNQKKNTKKTITYTQRWHRIYCTNTCVNVLLKRYLFCANLRTSCFVCGGFLQAKIFSEIRIVVVFEYASMCVWMLKRVYICGCYNNNGFKCDCRCGHNKYVHTHLCTQATHNNMKWPTLRMSDQSKFNEAKRVRWRERRTENGRNDVKMKGCALERVEGCASFLWNKRKLDILNMRNKRRTKSNWSWKFTQRNR